MEDEHQRLWGKTGAQLAYYSPDRKTPQVQASPLGAPATRSGTPSPTQHLDYYLFANLSSESSSPTPTSSLHYRQAGMIPPSPLPPPASTPSEKLGKEADADTELAFAQRQLQSMQKALAVVTNKNALLEAERLDRAKLDVERSNADGAEAEVIARLQQENREQAETIARMQGKATTMVSSELELKKLRDVIDEQVSFMNRTLKAQGLCTPTSQNSPSGVPLESPLLDSALAVSHAEIDQLTSDLAQARLEAEEAKQALSDLQDSTAPHNDARLEMQAQLHLLTEQLRAQKELTAEVTAERDAVMSQMVKQEHELGVHKKAQSELARVHAELEAAAANMLELSQAEISKLSTELEVVRASKKSDCESAQSSREECEKQVQKLQEELQECQQSLENFKEQSDVAQQLALDSQELANNLQQDLEKKEDELKTGKNAQLLERAEIQRLLGIVQKLERESERMTCNQAKQEEGIQQELTALGSEIEQKNSRISALLREQKELKEKLESALNTSAKEREAATEAKNSWKQQLSELEAERDAYSTQLQDTKMQQESNAKQTLVEASQYAQEVKELQSELNNQAQQTIEKDAALIQYRAELNAALSRYSVQQELTAAVTADLSQTEEVVDEFRSEFNALKRTLETTSRQTFYDSPAHHVVIDSASLDGCPVSHVADSVDIEKEFDDVITCLTEII